MDEADRISDTDRGGPAWLHTRLPGHLAADDLIWGGAIWASQVGDVTSNHFEVSGAAFWDSANPAVARGRASALIVYTGDSQDDPLVHQHIYGRIWVPNTAFLPVILRNR